VIFRTLQPFIFTLLFLLIPGYPVPAPVPAHAAFGRRVGLPARLLKSSSIPCDRERCVCAGLRTAAGLALANPNVLDSKRRPKISARPRESLYWEIDAGRAVALAYWLAHPQPYPARRLPVRFRYLQTLEAAIRDDLGTAK